MPRKRQLPQPGKPIVRTLSSGETIMHHHDGTLELVRDRSPLREKLDAQLQANQEAHDDLQIVHRQRIDFKKAGESAHPAVPSEKKLI